MKVSSVRIRPTDQPIRRRRRRRDQNSTCCCLGMVLVCGMIALIAARKPIARAIRGLFGGEETEVVVPPTFPLSLSVPREGWYRYDLVPLEVTYIQHDGSPISDRAPDVVARDAEGEIVETVGGIEALPLRYDAAKGTWRGSWPVPFGADAGEDAWYTFEAKATFEPGKWGWDPPKERRKREKEEKKKREELERELKEKGEEPGKELEVPSSGPQPEGEATCLATADFRVLRIDRVKLPGGTCAVTWEPGFPDTARLTRPDGTEGDWRVMFDWAQFMGADTFWFRGGVTEVYSAAGALSLAKPWVQHNIDAVAQMAEEAHGRGIKFGTWAVAYETYPHRHDAHLRHKQWKPKYRYTENYSRSRRVPDERAAISLLDKHRPTHIAEFFKNVQQIEGVDFVGLDYIRSGADWGGYELVEPFAEEMPVVGLPGEWGQMTRAQRMGWICRMLEVDLGFQRHADLYHQWNWYRAHRVSRTLRSIVEQADLKIPLWTFTLGWWHGEQHGQDPLMFADAGVAIDAVMLYECDTVGHYESVIDQWREGIGGEGGIPPDHINIMPGDQVSFNSHQRLTNPAAPEEMYRRITKAASQLTEGGLSWGAFVHDVSRICTPQGNRGPYPGREWALVGGAAFSKVRANWGVQPVRCKLTAPKGAPVGSTVTCDLLIQSTCDTEIKDIAITVMDTANINRISKQERVDLLPARGRVNVPIEVQIMGWDAGRASRYMIAAQIRWPEGEYGEHIRDDLPRLYTVMTYINAA